MGDAGVQRSHDPAPACFSGACSVGGQSRLRHSVCKRAGKKARNEYDLAVAAPPFTPTSAELAADGYRVYGGYGAVTGLTTNNDWILATFSNPVSTLLVFPNIDNLGSPYDGYQYTIEGSN